MTRTTAARCGRARWPSRRTELPPWSLGYVYLPAALAIVVTSFPMARVGARLSHRLPSATLRRIFAAVLIVIGVELILN